MTDTYDLLLVGGSLIDPARGVVDNQAVGITRGRITYVGPAVASDAVRAVRTIDVSGHYVLPGLVDLHSHVFRGHTFWGVDHRRITGRSGVTTWLDAGSSGAYSARGFRELALGDGSAGQVYAWLNISGIGLVGETFESVHLEHCDVNAARSMLAENHDVYVGLKVRIDANVVGSNGLEPLRRARSVADDLDVPIMVHIGVGPPSLDAVLDAMRPGDVLTHCYTGTNMSPVDESGRIRPSVRAARDRGVRLDLGHGAGGFSFATAERMIQAGYLPDTISSDVHQISVHGPMVDLVTCMNKLLCLGMPLRDVVAATTSGPARIAGLPQGCGTLEVGAPGDLAVMALDSGAFPLFDVVLDKRVASRRLRCTHTIAGGRVVAPELPESPPPWISVPDAQQQALRRLWSEVRHDAVFDAGAEQRFAPPDLLDWNGHG
jgi:dihydroorotase